MYDWEGLGPIAIIDVETTGLHADTDRILSLAVVLCDLDDLAAFEGKQVQGVLKGKEAAYSSMFDPKMPISVEASRVHGIRKKDIKGMPAFKEKAQEIRDLIGSRTIVGHNISFDKKFLNMEFQRAGVESVHRNKTRCTMLGACDFLSENFGYRSKRISLDNALKVFCLDGRKKKRHDAMEDTSLTGNLAFRLWSLQNLPHYDASLNKSIRKRYEAYANSGGMVKRQRKAESDEGIGCGCLTIIAIIVILMILGALGEN